ncbi:MAG: M48 family metallopeptidase [Planctomycetes bacterium]|nr:M48 family metallopeptidase [Planctomycetota bacterium]
MTPESHSIDWGSKTIEFSLHRADRKRVAIEVNPDLSVLVRAPASADLQPVLAVVRKKAKWILKQQRYFEQFLPRSPERTYVSGESHLYMGRHYRLKVHAVDDEPRVRLHGGYIHIYCADPADRASKHELVENWYRDHAAPVFSQRLAQCLDHRVFRKLSSPQVQIRKMKRRWGSCTRAGRVLLNLDLIRAPRRCIDYVVTHELCHLLVPEHTPEFFRLLRKVMPDWESRKTELEARLA